MATRKKTAKKDVVIKKKLSLTTVVKIDNTVIFDAIPTGLTKVSQLATQNDIDKVRQWNTAITNGAMGGKFKGPKSKDSLNYPVLNHRVIKEYIDNQKDWSLSTKNMHILVLANAMLAVDKHKYKQEARNYLLETKANSVIITNKQLKQELSNSEHANFVCFDDIQRTRDELYIEWMKDPDNRILNLKHLILALYTYIPPVRMNYLDMEIITDDKQIQPDFNFLLKTNDEYTFIFDNDKVKNSFESDRFELINNEYMHGDALKEVLDTSLEYYPRSYLLTAVRGDDTELSPMPESSFHRYLKSVFDGKNVYVNILRKAFINHFYDQSYGLASDVKKEIEGRMRHGADVTERAYNKPGFKDICKNTKPYINKSVKLEVQELKKIKSEEPEPEPQTKKEPEPKKEPYNIKLKTAEYREKNRELLREKSKQRYHDVDKITAQKTKLLKNLNNGSILNPRDSTLKKYGITLNEQTNVYH
jgi:hypothetical protein